MPNKVKKSPGTRLKQEQEERVSLNSFSLLFPSLTFLSVLLFPLLSLIPASDSEETTAESKFWCILNSKIATVQIADR